MNKLREWYYKRKLRIQKEKGLFEVRQDLTYIKTFKGEMLKYDESKARKRMSELKSKENRTPQEETELDGVLDVIAESKATKNEYRQSEKLASALEDYISLL